VTVTSDAVNGPEAGEAGRRFEALFDAHYASVLAYALRRVDAELAEDVAAETFLVAWRRLHRVPVDPLPWLYGVARKMIANQRRGIRRREALIAKLKQDASGARGPWDIADRVVERAGVLAALARLGERDREALRLAAWEGLETARAARAAGCSRAAFAVRLHRARRRLMKELASAGHIPSEMSTAPARRTGEA
jgi:RNA polymerase sigma-70 factor, ECF subfamily